ncbi:SMP-30/gluconolactonase/LRE family protein, partial [Klebsiella pneumoniae]|nr:SMP-30/gluconolactonase/LRE family protein [Klebsiella pneumoniae]
GYLWNALVYAGKLVRYTPEGKVDRIIEMPVKKVTSVMFGGSSKVAIFAWLTTSAAASIQAMSLWAPAAPCLANAAERHNRSDPVAANSYPA